MEEQKEIRINYNLIFLIFMLFIVSMVSIWSAQGQYEGNFMIKQMIWYVIGVGVLVGMMIFDLDQLRKLSWVFYGIGLFMLLLLLFLPETIAPERNGAKSWIMIPFMGSIQPAEFMKAFLIVFLSSIISRHSEKYEIGVDIRDDLMLVVKLGLATLAPIGLIMMQPDLGTSLVIISIFLGILFVSGINWRILLILFGSMTLVVGTIFYLILYQPNFIRDVLHVKVYQLGRIYGWLFPYEYETAESYHLKKSLLAIGSGGMYGKGTGNSEVYLPEAQTDFIFSIIGEEYGFIGGSVVVSIFFLLVYQITKIALDIQKIEPFGSYLCAGVIAMITFHVVQNVGMTIGVLPITGIPLPFISYGGSSLIGNMLAMGLVFGTQYRVRKYMFS